MKFKIDNMFTKKLLHLSLSLAVLCTVLSLSSCGEETANSNGDHGNDDIQVQETTDQSSTQRVEAVKQIFNTIPSPIEMASLIRKSGADFDNSILNSTDNADNYTSVRQQALNLGVYGADLSYASMFEQQQQSIYYLSAARGLAKQLGVEDAINNDLIERVNDNRNNKDSLLRIVADAYYSLNGYLKESDREQVSALVIAGGWIEALHLATTHVTPDNQKLKERIAEQKYSLKDLITLLETYEGAPELGNVITDLKGIQEVFNLVEIKKGKTETSRDNSGKMVIGGASSITMSDETLEAIKMKIQDVRSSYIK
ncbi:MAG: hypothetical protein ACPGED_00140 [Flavobacteriales bacterium]